MQVSVTKIRYALHSDWKNMNDDRKKMLYITDLIGESISEIDEELQDMNFIKADVKINDDKYIVYHGFPGDNPCGILLTKDEKHVICEFGEGMNDEVSDTCPSKHEKIGKKFLEWYNDDGDDISCNMFNINDKEDDEEEEEENQEDNEEEDDE